MIPGYPSILSAQQLANNTTGDLSKWTIQYAIFLKKDLEKLGANPSLTEVHALFYLLIVLFLTSQMLIWIWFWKKDNGQWFSGAVQNKSNLAASSLQSHLITFWSLQLWMLLSQLQNETPRLHQKPSCLSDAAYCNTGQLRWMLRPLRSCWKRLAFFFLCTFFFFFTP